jgi:hypothetical protein
MAFYCSHKYNRRIETSDGSPLSANIIFSSLQGLLPYLPLLCIHVLRPLTFEEGCFARDSSIRENYKLSNALGKKIIPIFITCISRHFAYPGQ